VRDAEDLVDRVAIVGLLLDPHEGEVEVLQMLPRLGEEHREIGVELHQRTRR
jgi:hypothetical protein